jgi:hypothetical protein
MANLLAIVMIRLLTRLVMRACLDWFAAIERGQLQFPGFYREWARPTGRLMAAALLLAGLVTAYPYLPGSGSRAFREGDRVEIHGVVSIPSATVITSLSGHDAATVSPPSAGPGFARSAIASRPRLL